MTVISWSRFPLVASDVNARRWLEFTANIGRAPNTVLAYGRAVDLYLQFCQTAGVDVLTARGDTVAGWIGAMFGRPAQPPSSATESGAARGMANATVQQRIVAVRMFYQFLVEDGLRERNPVRSGQRGQPGRRPRPGLVRRVEQAPWIPTEQAWQQIVVTARCEPLRNRLMMALAYDGALRREELVLLQVDDIDPAYSLIHLRAETTKSKRSREVAYGAATADLLAAYLGWRRQVVGRAPGRLLLSLSRRNFGDPIGLSTWSKAVAGIAVRAGVPRLTTHTFRHLRLTDLARCGWTVDQIALYAGHRNLSTTLHYIHLSGRELAAKLHRATSSLQLDREQLLATQLVHL